MDAIFDYSVEDEVVNGLTKLGLDPKQVKYVIVSHAHGGHVAARAFCRNVARTSSCRQPIGI
jgi:metallo-beta-lactamase class B